jgi:hypothetical protein
MQELEPVPDDLRALLEEEKGAGDPSSGTRERVLLRLAGTFALGGAGPLSPDGSSVPAGPSPIAHAGRLTTAARVVRVAAIFVTGAATGAGGYHVVARARHPAPVSAPVVAPAPRPETTAPPEASEPMPPPAPAPAPAPSVASVPIRMRPPSAVEPTPGTPERTHDPLEAERSLIEMARAALGRGKAESALAALRRHARQFPSGELTEEREGLLVQALVAAQKYDQAREKAEQFKKRYPRSLFTPVVDQAVGAIP